MTIVESAVEITTARYSKTENIEYLQALDFSAKRRYTSDCKFRESFEQRRESYNMQAKGQRGNRRKRKGMVDCGRKIQPREGRERGKKQPSHTEGDEKKHAKDR